MLSRSISVSFRIATVPPTQVKCPNCPTYQARIEVLINERDELRRLLTEKDRLIAELRARIEKLEMEARSWTMERQTLINKISERDRTITDLETRLKEAFALIESLVLFVALFAWHFLLTHQPHPFFVPPSENDNT